MGIFKQEFSCQKFSQFSWKMRLLRPLKMACIWHPTMILRKKLDLKYYKHFPKEHKVFGCKLIEQFKRGDLSGEKKKVLNKKFGLWKRFSGQAQGDSNITKCVNGDFCEETIQELKLLNRDRKTHFCLWIFCLVGSGSVLSYRMGLWAVPHEHSPAVMVSLPVYQEKEELDRVRNSSSDLTPPI